MKLCLAKRGISDLRGLVKASAGDKDSLRSLETLDISRNSIETLLSGFEASDESGKAEVSSVLGALPALTEVDLQSNRLLSLAGIYGGTQCRGLTRVNVSCNALRSLSGLEPLNTLTFLDVSDNLLESLDGLAGARAETSSEAPLEIYASKNRLRSLRGAVGRITILDVRFNNISSVDTLQRCAVRCRQLKRLDVDGNPVLINGSLPSNTKAGSSSVASLRELVPCVIAGREKKEGSVADKAAVEAAMAANQSLRNQGEYTVKPGSSPRHREVGIVDLSPSQLLDVGGGSGPPEAIPMQPLSTSHVADTSVMSMHSKVTSSYNQHAVSHDELVSVASMKKQVRLLKEEALLRRKQTAEDAGRIRTLKEENDELRARNQELSMRLSRSRAEHNYARDLLEEAMSRNDAGDAALVEQAKAFTRSSLEETQSRVTTLPAPFDRPDPEAFAELEALCARQAAYIDELNDENSGLTIRLSELLQDRQNSLVDGSLTSAGRQAATAARATIPQQEAEHSPTESSPREYEKLTSPDRQRPTFRLKRWGEDHPASVERDRRAQSEPVDDEYCDDDSTTRAPPPGGPHSPRLEF